MIFPLHRIVAQLIKDGDMTHDHAVVQARRILGLQGTIAAEDFDLLGQQLGFGGLNLPVTAGQFNQVGVAVLDTSRPVQVTVEGYVADVLTDLYLTLPSDLASFGAANGRFRDTNRLIAKPTAPLLAPSASIISRTNAAIVGQFVGRIPPNTFIRPDVILREGFGLVATDATIATVLECTFFWREKQLRVL